jgi:hypothetical protein
MLITPSIAISGIRASANKRRKEEEALARLSALLAPHTCSKAAAVAAHAMHAGC